MYFTDDEKLMLFLIWWHCECDISLETLSKEFNDSIIACGILKDWEFVQFLSEAHEAEEEFEMYDLPLRNSNNLGDVNLFIIPYFFVF